MPCAEDSSAESTESAASWLCGWNSLTDGLTDVADEVAVRLLQALRATSTSRGGWR
jgi:hypothetical protein